ncbi:MAG: LysM peptidoglycan-binding domain-containing protein [Anaerolineales bacterium]|nr:LysM peptidoglycan-binding domain-containing protein [Anaerolineales bacterium]
MMKNSHFLVITLIVLLVFGLSACERSAGSAMPEAESAESGEGYPIPEGTNAPMAELEYITTQTAMAESGVVDPGAAAPAGEEAAPAEEVKPTETQQPQAEPEQEEEAQPQAEVEDYPVPDTYTLQPGEFPYCIARRFDIAPAVLLSANGLSSSSMTYPGTVLKIPKDAAHYNLGSRALRSHPVSYVVRSGDTANSVACLFGDVDPRAILAKNNLQGSLPVGQTIQIP